MADYSRRSDDLPSSQLPPPEPSARERSVSMSQANHPTSPGAGDGGASQPVNGGGGPAADDADAGAAVAGTAVTDMSAKVQEVLASDVCLADQLSRELKCCADQSRSPSRPC